MKDANGYTITGRRVTWASEDPAVATVSDDGIVSGIAPGAAVIRATVDDVTDTTIATVQVSASGIGLQPNDTTLPAYTGFVYRLTVVGPGGVPLPPEVVQWSSSDPATATISSLGDLDATKAGVTLITAHAGTVSAVARVTVTPPPVATVEVDGVPATLLIHAAKAFHVTVRDARHVVLLDRPVTWSSSHPSILAVDPDGHILGLAQGQAVLTVAAETVSTRLSVTVDTLPPFTAVTAGTYHSCGVTVAGTGYCWGTVPSLLDGSPISSDTPDPVPGSRTWTALTAGSGFTCGLSDGAAFCWGGNASGQLGDGTAATRLDPVAVLGGHAFTQVSAGEAHACGVTVSHDAYCWGENADGQLGNGTTARAVTPVAVAGGHAFVQISAGRVHTCAVTTAGAAYCWGLNDDGNLGTGDSTGSAVPRPVLGGLTFTAVSASAYHTCALAADGHAYCWGPNVYGGLGNGSLVSTAAPVAVSGTGYTMVDAGRFFGCGVRTGGELVCFGTNEQHELGIVGGGPFGSDITQSETPAAPLPGVPFQQVSAGWAHTCAVSTAGDAYCWGAASNGQTGVAGYHDWIKTPTKVTGRP